MELGQPQYLMYLSRTQMWYGTPKHLKIMKVLIIKEEKRSLTTQSKWTQPQCLAVFRIFVLRLYLPLSNLYIIYNSSDIPSSRKHPKILFNETYCKFVYSWWKNTISNFQELCDHIPYLKYSSSVLLLFHNQCYSFSSSFFNNQTLGKKQ